MTKNCNRLRGERPKAFWGALVGGAMNLIGSAISSKSQARAIRRQIEAQKEAARTQLELANNSNLASTLNSYATATRSYNDEDDYNLKYRLGGNKRLGSNRIYITDGGNATKIGNDTYLLRGGSHEQTNETGQTGIGINVGGNEIEAEGGEVAQKKNGALRIFSAQPILGNGMSPAQAVMKGASKDKVFNAQQRFKRRNNLSDGGDTYKNGGVKGPTYNKQTKRWYNAQGKMLRVGHGYYSQNANKFVQYNTDGTVSRFSPLDWMDKELQGEKHTQSMRVGNKSISLKRAFTVGKGAMFSPVRQHQVQLKNNKNRGFTEQSEDDSNDVMNIVGGGEKKLFGKKFKVQTLNTKFAIPYGKGIIVNGREVSKNLLDSIAYNAGLNKYPIDKLNYAYGLPSQETHNGRITSGNILNYRRGTNIKEYNNAIANMNLFKNFGVIPANAVVRNWSNKNDAGTDKTTGYDLSTNLSPLYQSFDLFRRGLYNTGDKNHTKDVRTAGDLIINSPEFKTYWETSGKRQYTRGYNDTNKASSYDRMINSNKEYSRYINHYPSKRLFKLGGRCKLREGDEVPYNHYDPTGLFGGDPHPLAKMVDVTGITSWGDVKKLIDKKKRGEIPTTQEYLSALSAIPAIGRIPKIINTIGNIADATSFMEDVRRSEAKEEAYQNEIVKYRDIHGKIKTGRRGSMPANAHELRKRLGGRMRLRNGGLTSKDRGSSKHPYPSVSSKDFAGGGRSYPIPTKADAVDALRLAGLHGRSDVKTKVYSRYPELRKKAEMGTWVKPVYNTSKYRGTSRARKQIAKWEGSDFAGQNAQFKGDAIGAKERELRQFMGKAYNYLNDNQRDALLSYYYNVVPKSFRGQMTKYRNALINAQTEQEYNDTLNNMRESINIGANRKGMSGLRNRRAIERNWFGYTTPMNTNKTRAILKQQDDAKLVQPTDNTRVVVQPQYIEVPAPVGHGIVPIDNPDPNLLQGNIKDNLINMGNKFRLGQRCGGSTRVRKSLGGESRPVKGMRRKLTWGDVTYPYRRNNNFDYWDIIDQEQKANDKGGISPWTTSNNYDVKVPYAITKSTPTIPYTSKVSTPTSGVSENKTIPTYIGNKSGMIIRDADWYGLGADLVSSIGGSILGLGAYKNLDFDYNLPNFVEESPVALNTTYHNEAQKSNVERNRLNSRNSILRNTMSGSTAIGRMQGVDTNALYQLNQLADEKTNKETELMNQNLLNEQQVRARNAAARNQYYNTVASIKNAAIQAKNEAELAKGQILSGSLQGIGNSFQNFISQGRQNYDDTQAMLMGVAASDYATPSRLLELGVDVGDDAALAGIYRSAMNVPNPGARPKREDYSDNTEYSYALTRWENQNKAYQRRNSYVDLIKGRMSKKNLIKYGII